MDRLNIGRISSKKMDMLQDLSVDFSQFVKKYIKNLKKLSSKDQRAFGKLFGDFKDGLDDLSTNESVNELDTKKADTIRKSMPGYVGPKFAKKASDEDILAMADLKDEKAKIYNRYLKDVMGKISKLQKKYNIKESVNESVNEVQEPEIITQLRKGGYQTLKDPQTGKKVKIDNYSSSAIVAVYDALKKDKVKAKFVNLPLLKMANVAFKAMK